ncbi:DMP19 family protein [Massilia sp. BKSP1R2A-1]|uniref:DMP19 family protein n=1 Tax=Massilia sp. BKSP1R2A-1 TaxID=3422595 RepID=UPI003D3495AB
MSRNIDTCFEIFDQVKQLALLDQSCRAVVTVYSAWGVIGNGGLQYFFENNFDGDPSFDVFTEAFHTVGLDEIATRFSELVALFPFGDPHKSSQRRQEFLDSQPPNFTAAMEKLEHLIYKHNDIEGTLNAFLTRKP